MAIQITASIYSFNNNPDWAGSVGRQVGFPPNNIIISSLSPTIDFNSVTCNSIIEIIGQPWPWPIYYAKESASLLIYNSNQ